MILFLKIFFTEFIAEMGDKTQLMLIALTSKYKLRDIICGTAIAILVLNGLAVLAGGLVSELIPEWLIKMIAAFAFLYFAASTIAGDEEEEEDMVDDLDYLHIERCLVRVRGEQLLKHKSFNFLIQPTDIDIYNKRHSLLIENAF